MNLDDYLPDVVACASRGHSPTLDVTRYTNLQPCRVVRCACGESVHTRIAGEIVRIPRLT